MASTKSKPLAASKKHATTWRWKFNRRTGNKTLVDTGVEQIETEEMVTVSSAQDADEDSPLTYTAEPGADTRFDIDVPTK